MSQRKPTKSQVRFQDNSTTPSNDAAGQAKPAVALASSSTIPNRIGSLNFCEVCGNLLDVPGDDDTITCVQCGHTEDAVRASNTLLSFQYPTVI
jgi:hypothetical protein